MPAPFVGAPEPGDVLAGKYRVERVLGVGGMGMVLAAHHLQLDERVALKFLLPETAANVEAVKRFVREARAAVKIKSDHVARVSDVATLENGAPYLVMEYLEGADLASELERRGPFSVEEAVEFVLQACEAIAEAHSLGIVHRDLKPANLFLTRRAGGVPWIKVLDFGISKLSRGPDVGMTSTAAVMGSPLYMSPEQIRATREADARSDVWALGVILYELLCGRLPFKGDTLPQLSVNIAIEPPDPFPALVGVPAPLAAAVFRCLEKDRERRFANIAEFAQALAPFASKRAAHSIDRILAVLAVDASALPPSSSMPLRTEARPTGAAFGRTGAVRAETAEGVPRRRGLWGVALGLAAVTAVGTMFIVRSNASWPAASGSAPLAASSAALTQPSADPRSVSPASPTLTPSVVPIPVAAVSSEAVTAEPAASASASVAVARPGVSRGRKVAAARANTAKPGEPSRPPPSPAAAPTPEPRPALASQPAAVDVFNNRTF
jgi:serine/threonine-protein kinase